MIDSTTSACHAAASSELAHSTSDDPAMATLTREGQATIPKQIRERLAMKAGDRMTFTLLPDGTVLMRVKNKSILSVAGCLYRKGQQPIPTEDLSR